MGEGRKLGLAGRLDGWSLGDYNIFIVLCRALDGITGSDGMDGGVLRKWRGVRGVRATTSAWL